MATTQKMVINQKMHQFTADFYRNLFKPTYNGVDFGPWTEVSGKTVGDAPDNNNRKWFMMEGSNHENYPKTLYNNLTANNICHAFLCTESAITVINKLQKTMYNTDGSYKTTFVDYVYKDNGIIDWTASTINEDRCKMFGKNTAGTYEMYSEDATRGIFYTMEVKKKSKQYRSSSQTFAEILLRHLYSYHAQFRNDAFDAIGSLLQAQVTQQEIDAAKRCWIPLMDLNPNDFNLEFDGMNAVISNSQPTKLEQQFRANVHNPNGESLYLFVPQISSCKVSDYRPVVGINSESENSGCGDYYSYQSGDIASNLTTEPDNASVSSLMMYSSTGIAEDAKRTTMIPYAAFTITDTGNGGDIQFDYVDEIDYFDQLRFVINGIVEYTNP